MIHGLWTIPSQWRWTKIGHIGEIIGGGTPPSTDEGNFDESGLPWLTPADLTGYDGTYVSRGRRSLSARGAANSSARSLPPGAVLYSSRAPIGYCVIAANELSTNQGFKNLILRHGISSEFVRYYLLASKDYAESMASGTTFKELSGERFSNLEIPIAPNPEQRRIVAKLDSLFTRTKKSREELARIPRLVERYKEALLRSVYAEALAAVTTPTTLGAITEEVRNGVSRKPENAPPGIPILKISAVRAMNVRFNERRYYAAETGEDVSRYALQPGDLLFTRYNGNPHLVANCGMVRVVEGLVIYPDKLIRVRLNREVAEPEFVEALCASPQVRDALAPFIKSAAGQHGISGSDLKSLSIPLPAREHQHEIVDSLRRALSVLDATIFESKRAADLLDRIEPATLAKAFRGKLVPQDPKDDLVPDFAHIAIDPPPRRVRGKRVPVDHALRAPKEKTAMAKSRQDEDVNGKPYLANLLRKSRVLNVEDLFRTADLPVADFYKQLAWEVQAGHIKDNPDRLEAA